MDNDSRNNCVEADSQSYYVNTKHKCKKSLKYARIKVYDDKAVECMWTTPKIIVVLHTARQIPNDDEVP
jgi:hypothetical protein